MSLQNISLFKAIGAKMQYLAQSQAVISQNVANSDTPGYTARKIEKADFDNVLRNVTRGGGSKVRPVSLAATNSDHIGGASANIAEAKVRESRDVYEISPTGNSVIIEEQLLEANRNSMNYTFMTNLYQKQMGMLRTALGTQR